MGVVPDGLDMAEEREHEADSDGEELDGGRQRRPVAEHQQRRRRWLRGVGGDARKDTDEGGEGDGRGGEHCGRHDVVPHRLHCQDAVLLWILSWRKAHESARPLGMEDCETY